MQLAFINDKLLPLEALEPVYLDRGLFFGDGVYEVLRSYNGKIFALEEHMQRFAASLAAIEIMGVDISWIRSRVVEAFEAAKLPDVKIYFHITRGSGPRNHICDDDLKPNFFLTVMKVDDDTSAKTSGFSVSTYPDCRWKRCDIKSLNLLPNVMARRDAAKKGCDEAVFVNDAGLITEGSSSAFFAISGKKLHTSPLSANILPSITRKFVIKAAGLVGLEIAERSLTPQQAGSADELFIAVTTKDIVPVVKFDGRLIGNGKPGQYTKLLAAEFREFT
jgi:D-alanine transaminase